MALSSASGKPHAAAAATIGSSRGASQAARLLPDIKSPQRDPQLHQQQRRQHPGRPSTSAALHSSPAVATAWDVDSQYLSGGIPKAPRDSDSGESADTDILIGVHVSQVRFKRRLADDLKNTVFWALKAKPWQ